YFFKAFSGFFSNALHHLSHSLAALPIVVFKSSFTSWISNCSSSQFLVSPPVWLELHPIACSTSVSVGAGILSLLNTFGSRLWHWTSRYRLNMSNLGDGVNESFSLWLSWAASSGLELCNLFVTERAVFAPRTLEYSQTESISRRPPKGQTNMARMSMAALTGRRPVAMT